MAYCDRCDRFFPHDSALRQHQRDSYNHYVCWGCNLDFSTWTGLKEHYVQSPRHDYCQSCDEHFDDEEDLISHYLSEHDYCSTCNKLFKNEYGLEEHWRQSAIHHYCSPCKRHFMSASNLHSHLNSSTHRPRDVPCPFKGCQMSFVSRSALVLHLESGTCRSGVDRSTINRYVRQYDKTNIITDPSRLLTAGNSSEVKYFASNASWNGSGYECYLCHGTYRTLNSLNQHLASPRHQDKIYRCPLQTCAEKFTTLSALCQHIESERCGVSKFKNVQKALNSVIGGMRQLTF